MPYTFITGATGVLGSAFAAECLSRGEKLLLTGRSADKLAALKIKLLEGNPQGEILTFACDLTDEIQRGDLFEFAKDLKFSRLINVAGADIQMPFGEYDQNKLTFQIRINYEAAASLSLFAIERRAEKLKIINVSSVCGIVPMPYFAVYASAKGALTSLSVALNREYKGTGVSVCAVLPGSIYTRPDVVEYIKKQGLWGKIAAKEPQFVVRKSLVASDKGKGKVVLGGANKLTCALTRIVPSRVRLNFIAKRWSKARKDAF